MAHWCLQCSKCAFGTTTWQEVLQFLVLDDSSVDEGSTTEINRLLEAWDEDDSSETSSDSESPEPKKKSCLSTNPLIYQVMGVTPSSEFVSICLKPSPKFIITIYRRYLLVCDFSQESISFESRLCSWLRPCCSEILRPPVPQAKPKTKVPVRSESQRRRPRRRKRKKRRRRQACHFLLGLCHVFPWGTMCGLILGDGFALMSSTPHGGIAKWQIHFVAGEGTEKKCTEESWWEPKKGKEGQIYMNICDPCKKWLLTGKQIY